MDGPETSEIECAARNLVAALDRLRSERTVLGRANQAARAAIDAIACVTQLCASDCDASVRELRTANADRAADWAMKKQADVRAAERCVQRAIVHLRAVAKATGTPLQRP